MPSLTKLPYIIDLPFEIWQHISSFLSTEEAWALHGLNRMLRNIALDKRYRCVKLNFAPRHYGSYATRLCHLGEEHIANRVREMCFHPNLLVDSFNLKLEIPGRDDARSRSPLRGIFEETSVPDANAIVNTIARFKKVSSLRIESFHDIRLRPPALQLIHGGLRIFANNLRSLVLSFPLEMMSTIILPDLVLTRLESLEIIPSSLERPKRHSQILSVFSNTLKATIIPFVNRHRLSLRSINFLPPKMETWIVFNYKATQNFNFTPFLEGLNPIPHLESISISVLTCSATNNPTYRFLARYPKTLRCLKLSLASMSTLDYQNLLDRLDIPLPHLEALTLDFGFRSRHRIIDPSLPKFLGQYSSSLKSLKLLGKQHGKSEICSLLEIPYGYPIFYSKLRHLEIWLYCLTPEILDLISSSLPDLEDLELTVRIFRGEIASIKNERIQFCIEMSLRNYCEWRLQRLLLKNIDAQTMSRSNINCIYAVVEALPHLLTINEVHREDYLSGYLRA